jgi:anthranilate phosphoribosyltransferase
MAEVTPAGFVVSRIKPEDFGFSRCSMSDLRGGDAAANAGIVRAVLAGEKGPRRDIVLLNSAYALVAAGRVATPEEGIRMAADGIDSGRALEQVARLVRMTSE